MACKVAGDKGISETKSKQPSPCSNCMHQPVMSWGSTCMHKPVRCMHQPVMSWGSTCMHKPVRCMHQPVMSQANARSYCKGSVVLILSQIYLYSSDFAWHAISQKIYFIKIRSFYTFKTIRFLNNFSVNAKKSKEMDYFESVSSKLFSLLFPS